MKKLLSFLICLILITLPSLAVYADAAFDSLMKEEIRSPIYLLTSLDDSTVVLSKGADKKTQCPALNKIITVALALKYNDNIDRKITITEQMLENVSAYSMSINLKVGEEISIKSLLYAIMLYGANDACSAVAVATSSSEEKFLESANAYISSLGCKDTVLKTVAGFDAEGQSTTAKDISVIMADVVKIPLFMEIFGAKTYTVDATNLSDSRSFSTGNRLQVSTSIYYYSYVSGGKSGATDEAGYCTIATATKDGYTYLAVVLKGEAETDSSGYSTNYSMLDAKTLFKWAFNNIKFKVVATQSQIVMVMDVIAGSESDHVSLSPAKDISTLVPYLADENGVLIEPIKKTVPEKLYAPVKKGDVICKAKILYAGEEIAKVELVAAETVNLSVPRLVLEKIKDVLKSKIFIAVLIILAALILIYILFVIFDNLKSKRNRMNIIGK